MGPRIPSLRGARIAVLGILAALCVARLRLPSQATPLAWVASPEGCRLDRPTRGPACPCQALPTRARRLQGLPLSLDRATATDLVELPGVGVVRARAIVRERETHGRFMSPAALGRVPGIAEGLAASLAPWLYSGDHDPACD